MQNGEQGKKRQTLNERARGCSKSAGEHGLTIRFSNAPEIEKDEENGMAEMNEGGRGIDKEIKVYLMLQCFDNRRKIVWKTFG